VAVDDRLAALWITYVRTGARRGELLAATWADVDLDDAKLAIRRTRVSAHIGGHRTVYDKAEPKTSTSRRTVTLDDDNVAVLRAHRARQAAERLAASGRMLAGGLTSALNTNRPRPRLRRSGAVSCERRGRESNP
jgi:integrase